MYEDKSLSAQYMGRAYPWALRLIFLDIVLQNIAQPCGDADLGGSVLA